MSKDESVLSDLNPIQMKYSKYAVSLDRIFKHNSLKGLHNQLKNPKIIKFNELDFERKDKNIQDPIAEKLNLLPKIETIAKNSRNQNVSDNPQTKRGNSSFISNMSSNKPKKISKPKEIEETPGPGKYNPNCNIRYKKIDGFVSWKKSNQEKNRASQIKVKKLIDEEKKSQEKSFFINDSYNENSMISRHSRNSALRFSLYLERKSSFEGKNFPIISYINQQEKKKIGIPDFSKMSSRERRVLVKRSQCPPVCCYRPKYEFVDSTPVKALQFSKEKSVKKKLNMSKILCSYDVPLSYLSVDLDNDKPSKQENYADDYLNDY